MTVMIAIILLATIATENAFKIRFLNNFFGRKNTVFCSSTNTFDFDMVRPAIQFTLGDVIDVSTFMRDYDIGAKIQGYSNIVLCLWSNLLDTSTTSIK